MSVAPWSLRPKIDELTLTDILMRRVPTGGANLNQEIPFSDVQAFLQGSALEIIAKEADLPPLVDGFRTLDQTKDYNFTEPGLFFDPILIPAGYIGFIKSSFLKEGTITYLGAGSFFNTLNIDGVINSIADATGGAITVTTSAAHGLLDGQFVNITGAAELTYNQSRLVISNVTSTTFDVQIPFVTDESGAFNTGFEILQFSDIDFISSPTANLFDLTSSESLGSFLITSSMTELGFLSPGIIRNCPVVAMDITLLGFITDGMTFENCRNISLFRTRTPSLDPLSTTARGLIFQGSLTFEVVVDAVGLDMSDPDQRPIRIDPTVPTISSYTIQNSPDNLVATDYYDTSAGGLPKTDPRVIALNNGSRANSMTLAEARSAGIFTVDGSGGVAVPVQNLIPLPGNWIQDSTTEEFSVDVSTGLTTYNGIRPISVKIEYSISAAQSGAGGNQSVDFDLRITGVAQTKTTRTVMTNGQGNFVPVSYDGGNFDINPADTFQIFKNNTTNTNNTDTTIATLLITKIG